MTLLSYFFEIWFPCMVYSGLELKILLLLHPKCWDYRYKPPPCLTGIVYTFIFYGNSRYILLALCYYLFSFVCPNIFLWLLISKSKLAVASLGSWDQEAVRPWCGNSDCPSPIALSTSTVAWQLACHCQGRFSSLFLGLRSHSLYLNKMGVESWRELHPGNQGLWPQVWYKPIWPQWCGGLCSWVKS